MAHEYSGEQPFADDAANVLTWKLLRDNADDGPEWWRLRPPLPHEREFLGRLRDPAAGPPRRLFWPDNNIRQLEEDALANDDDVLAFSAPAPIADAVADSLLWEVG
jgi:hypothetical protein